MSINRTPNLACPAMTTKFQLMCPLQLDLTSSMFWYATQLTNSCPTMAEITLSQGHVTLRPFEEERFIVRFRKERNER